MPAPVGAIVMHGILLTLMIHFNTMREVYGERAAIEMDWTWLPEVACVATPPEPPPPAEPPPEILPESIPDPSPTPEPEPELSPPPSTPVPEEAPLVPPENLFPEPEPPPPQKAESIPPPPPPAADIASTQLTNAWTQVRSDILKSLRYPAFAQRNGIEGVVTVTLKLNESGEIASTTIRRPSPSKWLSEATLEAVRRASPFPEAGTAIRQGQISSAAEISVRFQLGSASF